MKNILITGSTGLIGQQLAPYLSSLGYQVQQLSRKINHEDINIFHWNIETNEIDVNALDQVEHVIHLAGANIGERRWTKKRKEEILNSRVKSTRLLFNLVKKMEVRPKSIISASAVGFYGAKTVEHIFIESGPSSGDFIGSTCQLWEDEVLAFESLGVRTIRLRFGVVLSQKGGALNKMILPAKLGLGSALGSGKQYLPWIHIDDAVRVIEWCFNNEFRREVFNVCSNNHTKFKNFSKLLSETVSKPHFLPNVPSFLLKMVFGEMSQIILEGSRISSQKLISNGFKFNYPHLKEALSDLLKN